MPKYEATIEIKAGEDVDEKCYEIFRAAVNTIRHGGIKECTVVCSVEVDADPHYEAIPGEVKAARANVFPRLMLCTKEEHQAIMQVR